MTYSDQTFCKYIFLLYFDRDALIVTIVNAGFSFFAGFVTFAIIGSIAQETNRPVTELVESGKIL